MIAYEPMCAIGTGKVASAAQVQDAQAVSPDIAQGTRVIYAGSVNAANCKELGACSVSSCCVAG